MDPEPRDPCRWPSALLASELSFESDELLRRALASPEMGAAVEDAKGFLDMEKTSMIEVEEQTVVDRVGT